MDEFVTGSGIIELEVIDLIGRVLESEQDMDVSEENGVRRRNIFVMGNRSFESFED